MAARNSIVTLTRTRDNTTRTGVVIAVRLIRGRVLVVMQVEGRPTPTSYYIDECTY